MVLAIQVLAIFVPILCGLIVTLIGFSIKQLLNNLNLQIATLQREIVEHETTCEKNKEVTRQFNHWLLESIGLLAGTTGTKLPNIPY